MKSLRGAVLLLSIFYLISCKSQTLKSPSEPPNLHKQKQKSSQDAPDFLSFEKSIQLVEKQDLSFDIEFERFKTAIADYYKTNDYKNPNTDDEKAFNELIEMADKLTKDELTRLMQSGRFTEIEGRMKHLPDVEQKAHSILQTSQASDEEKEGLQLADTAQENSQAKNEGGIPLEHRSSRTSLQFGTGISLAVFGGMGFLGSVSSMVKEGKFRPWGALLSIWPLTVGILLAVNENPTQGTVTAAQAYLGIKTAAAGLATLGLGALFVGSLHPNVRTQLEGLHPKAKNFVEGYRARIGIGALVAAGITAGLGVWTAEMGKSIELAEIKISAKDEVMSKIGRSHVAFRVLESRGAF
ncbi:MAG: hypothetical protein KA436_06960 [Oligoflexales bacterium]|nr:hypothetical protein [Oligoflexales bacterium]